ncbi:hypothetical protein WA026_003553 [Henosepilachna vigintioctopunctata]|uniref:Regucalcin n=1 Tax=Henosepilachna vigintioctopunctata TaxID=420089 RepID=A0AAW1TIJ5_9CUCU
MAPTIEKVVQNMELGEAPHWDIASQSLYFVDIYSKAINRFVPSTKTHTKAHLDHNVSFIIPVEGEKNKFIVGLEKSIAIIVWDGISDKVEEVKKLADVDGQSSDAESKLNDSKCDATGRLWAGTMGVEKTGNMISNKGHLYSFEKGVLNKHLDQIDISNGLTWSRDNKKFFHIDTPKPIIYQYDFDISTGKLSNKKVHFTLTNSDGFPDGMTIDEEENLWVAVFGGYKILKIDSKKPETLLSTIDLPAKQVTSLAWGGQNLDELYVTSGKLTMAGEVLSPPDHGTLYKITGTGSKGVPMYNCKV